MEKRGLAEELIDDELLSRLLEESVHTDDSDSVGNGEGESDAVLVPRSPSLEEGVAVRIALGLREGEQKGPKYIK